MIRLMLALIALACIACAPEERPYIQPGDTIYYPQRASSAELEVLTAAVDTLCEQTAGAFCVHVAPLPHADAGHYAYAVPAGTFTPDAGSPEGYTGSADWLPSRNNIRIRWATGRHPLLQRQTLIHEILHGAGVDHLHAGVMCSRAALVPAERIDREALGALAAVTGLDLSAPISQAPAGAPCTE